MRTTRFSPLSHLEASRYLASINGLCIFNPISFFSRLIRLTHILQHSGWGRSVTHSSHRGHCGPTSLVLSDITSILSSQIPSPVPLFLMGHSMGGAEVLTYAALGPPHIRAHIRGYLAESPLIAVHPSSVPSRFTIIIGRLAAKLLPKHQLKQRIESKWVSRDPEVARIFMEDDLCHDTGTLEGLSSMLDRSADLVSGKVNVRENPDDPNQGGKISIWVGHGTEDHVTSFEATQKWMDKLDIKDKTFKIYDGWYHKRKCSFAAFHYAYFDRDSFLPILDLEN